MHGHRGARAVRPENTIPAFEYAIEAGADFIELDIVITKDDLLVVSHDPIINTEIGAFPTLDEVLDLAPRGAFGFDLEIKSFPNHPEHTPPPERFSELVLEAIRRHKLESRVAVYSFDFRTLRAMKQLAPDIKLAALDETGAADFVTLARSAEAQIISPEKRLITPQKVKSAHAAGLEVVAWTANTPRVWDKLIAAGVDGIITDDPAGLIEHLRARKLR